MLLINAFDFMARSKPEAQLVQQAINGCDRSHTEIHRAIAALKRGEITEAKRLMSQAITFTANALSVL